MENNGMEELRRLVARLERQVHALGEQQKQADALWVARAKRWEKDGGPRE
jgi:hypothetical protein